jgi:signal transduction histidine kinase
MSGEMQGRPFGRTLARAVVLPLLVMLLLALALDGQIGYLLSRVRRVEHVNRLIALTQHTEAELVDLESSVRGYLLTGDGDFLEAFGRAGEEATRAMTGLREAVAEGQDEEETAQLLAELQGRWAVFARSASDRVERRREGDLAGGLKPGDQELLAAMRSVLERIIAAAEGERNVDARRVESATRVVAASSMALTVLLGIALFLYALRQIRRVTESYSGALTATEEALRAREEFLSVASHELKTPLTSLRLQVGSALRSLRTARAAGAPAHLSERLETADRQADRLAHLIDRLIDSSRAPGGDLELSLGEVDLATVARQAVSRSRQALSRAGCEVDLRAPRSLRGLWDRARLEQAVLQLLANAAKYGPGRPILVTVESDGATARLSVRDQGIGIEEGLHHRIFERFGRAVSHRHYGGFGLGLWTVRRVASALGGQVRVESRPGEGSTFRLELPLRPPAEPPPEPPPSTAAAAEPALPS